MVGNNVQVEGNVGLSIVVPVFNEQDNVEAFNEALHAAIPDSIAYEVLYIDDGSDDDSLLHIKNISSTDSRVKYLAFSRNFGHQYAVKAGLDYASGDCVIMLDGDFQHPVELIPSMLKEWKAGADVVNMLRVDDYKFNVKSVTSRFFYSLINKLSDFSIKPGSADFRLLDRKVVNSLKKMGESTLFLRGLIPWVGYNQCDIEYQPLARRSGRSKYSFKKMCRLALMGIVSSSVKPLRLSSYLGCMIAALAAIYAIYALYAKFFIGDVISGWTSVLISVLFLGGTQLIMLGIIGEYLGRTLSEVKGRPLYLVKEHNCSSVKH